MAGISRQIGWSQESNLLYYILQQLIKLKGIIFNLTPKYKTLDVLLSQTGINPPTIISVLENNTGGTFTTDYAQPGTYNLIFPNNTFTPQNNILGFAYSGGDNDSNSYQGFIVTFNNDDKITLRNPNGTDEHIIIRASIKIY
jgi:hypothetical protein